MDRHPNRLSSIIWYASIVFFSHSWNIYYNDRIKTLKNLPLVKYENRKSIGRVSGHFLVANYLSYHLYNWNGSKLLNIAFMFLLNMIFYVFVLSCVCYVLCASVYVCFVVTCWERADLLALVCGVYCEFVTFPLVSWVRCGTWLYRFLIFAPLLTLTIHSIKS